MPRGGGLGIIIFMKSTSYTREAIFSIFCEDSRQVTRIINNATLGLVLHISPYVF